MKPNMIFKTFVIFVLIILIGIFPFRRNIDETYICTNYDSNNFSLGDIEVRIYGSEWRTIFLEDYFNGYI